MDGYIQPLLGIATPVILFLIGYKQKVGAKKKETPHVLLDMFFRRHGARIEAFPLSLKNPETLHSLEINGVLKNEGGGVVQNAVIILYMQSRILSPQSLQKNETFRCLKLKLGDEEENVYRTEIVFGNESNISLFKGIEYRLFDEDLGINFKHLWVEENKSPFIMWEIRVPQMESTKGFLKLVIEDNSAKLKPATFPIVSEILQNGKGRSSLESPDLSLDSKNLRRGT